VYLLDYALIGMKADLPISIAGLMENLLTQICMKKHLIHLITLYEFDKFNMVWIRNGY
jgi:hypothetical protein